MSNRKFIYVPELHRSSFLLFFHKGASDRSYSLRDFSRGLAPSLRYGTELQFTAAQILGMAQTPGNYCLDAPAHPVADIEFWRSRTEELNQRHLKPDRTVSAECSSPTLAPDTVKLASQGDFPVLDIDALRKLKAGKRRDLERILTSPQSEDYVTWNIGRLLLRKDTRTWWPSLVELARRANPRLSVQFAPDDLPSLSFWRSVMSPKDYERSSRARMRASGEQRWELRASEEGAVEGESEIDLVISGTGYLFFVEAKLGSDVSMRTTYDPERNQIVRNIDCLLEKAEGRCPMFWLFVRDTAPARAYVQLVHQYQQQPGDVAWLLPHRTQEDLDGVVRNVTLISWAALYDLVRDVDAPGDEEMERVKRELEHRILGYEE